MQTSRCNRKVHYNLKYSRDISMPDFGLESDFRRIKWIGFWDFNL